MPGCVYFRRPAFPLLNDTVIAYDIMQPIRESASPDMPLYKSWRPKSSNGGKTEKGGRHIRIS